MILKRIYLSVKILSFNISEKKVDGEVTPSAPLPNYGLGQLICGE
jgi:hypothetical protein